MIQIATLTCLLLTAAPDSTEGAGQETEQNRGPRVRWGLSAGWLVDNHPEWTIWPHRPEVSGTIHLGAQLNDQFALYGLLQMSTIIAGSSGKVGVLAEYTIPNGQVSLATGGAVSIASESCVVPAAICWDADSPTNVIPSAGIPARISVNFGHADLYGHRHRFSILLDGYAGLIFDKQGFIAERAPIQMANERSVLTYQAGIGFGYQMM